MGYFANRKRRKDIKWVKKQEEEWGTKPGVVFEDEESRRYKFEGRFEEYFPSHSFYSLYRELDKNNIPINTIKHYYPPGIIWEKIGFFTPSHWKRHLKDIKTSLDEISELNKQVIY